MAINNHLMVMALVGVVAVAGLVVLQQGSSTGMVTNGPAAGMSCYFNAMDLASNTRCVQIPETTGRWAKIECSYPGVWEYISEPYVDSKCRFFERGSRLSRR